MPYYTPLRYPGGKRRLAPAIVQLLKANRLNDIEYYEPYAGSAAIAFVLLFEEHAARVHINDLSRPIYCFWQSALTHTEELCERIEKCRISVRQWKIQRKVFSDSDDADPLDLGFATFFLNRTNRSGILGGGIIGGVKQTGTWKADARFNRDDLIARIRKIARYRNRIQLSQMDAMEFLSGIANTDPRKSFVFIDPPYIDNGDELYLDHYDLNDHRNIAKQVERLKVPWVVTYDDASLREGLYGKSHKFSYSLSYSAQARYEGKEAMFVSRRLKLPKSWEQKTRILFSSESSKHPLLARSLA